MGYAYYNLIPAAVMHLHPGCSKEELLELLQEVQYSGRDLFNPAELIEITLKVPNASPEEIIKAKARYRSHVNRANAIPWDLKNSQYGQSYTEDLFDLAECFNISMNIEEMERWKKINAKPDKLYSESNHTYDKDDVYKVGLRRANLHPKRYSIDENLELEKENKPLFRRWTYYGPKEQLRPGQIISGEYFEDSRAGNINVIDKVVKIWDDNEVAMQITPYNSRYRTQEFESLDELIRNHPELDPQKIIDWSQESGKVYRGDTKFKWFQQNHKYYFDEEDFKRQTLHQSSHHANWNDFILTVEAVRTKSYKMLSYCGKSYADPMLRKFPESAARHRQAIWDMEMARLAAKGNLSNSELLRQRLLLNKNRQSLEEIGKEESKRRQKEKIRFNKERRFTPKIVSEEQFQRSINISAYEQYVLNR